MLTSILITTLEQAFSFATAHQIQQHERWTALYNHPILIHLEQPKLSLYLVIHKESVTLRQAQAHETVTVSLTCSLQSLLSSLQGQRPKQKIQIQGQAHIATLLSNYIHAYKPDYTSILEPYLGKSMTYGITSQIKKACQRIQTNHKNLIKSQGEYIQHELKLTPNREAVQIFCSEVDTLYNQIDILLNTVDRLERKQNKRKST